MVRSPSPLPHGDLFAGAAELTAQNGRLVDRHGRAMVAWPSELLRSLHGTLKVECGPVADTILRQAGKSWGGSLARQIARDLSDHHAVALVEIPAARVLASLSSLFARAGWGRIDFLFECWPKGLVEVSATNGPSTAWSDATTPAADPLLGGALAGLFAELTGADLDCLQTDYEVQGQAPARFVIGLPQRLARVADAARQGQPHDRVIALLESISL